MFRLLSLLLALQPASSALSSPSYQRRNTTNDTFNRPNGADWGHLIVNNHCPETLNLWSIGVWNLNGSRDPAVGFGTPDEQIMHPIVPNGTWTEPFRVTCPYPQGWTMEAGYANNATWEGYEQLTSNTAKDDKTGKPLTAGYCVSEDKLAGQGVAIKIAREPIPEKGKVLQFEYALVKDPNRGDKTHRINYDVSLLDCGPEHADITDSTASAEQLQEKFDHCPGYDGGLAVTFTNDTKGQNCPTTYCNGVDKCFMTYIWERTRQGESSLSCEEEYWGDMVLDLCVERAGEEVQKNAESMGNQWVATAKNLPSGVIRPNSTTPTSISLSTGSQNPSTVIAGSVPVYDSGPTQSSETSGSAANPTLSSPPSSIAPTDTPLSTNVSTQSIARRSAFKQRSATPSPLLPRSLNSTMATVFRWPTRSSNPTPVLDNSPQGSNVNPVKRKASTANEIAKYATTTTATMEVRGICNPLMYYPTPCVN